MCIAERLNKVEDSAVYYITINLLALKWQISGGPIECHTITKYCNSVKLLKCSMFFNQQVSPKVLSEILSSVCLVNKPNRYNGHVVLSEGTSLVRAHNSDAA